MKKGFVILMIAVLSITPLYASATEEDSKIDSTEVEVLDTDGESSSEVPAASSKSVDDDVDIPVEDTSSEEESGSTVDEDLSLDEAEIEGEIPEDDKTPEDEEKEEKEHEHEYTYLSNGDGTHTVKCTEKVYSEEEGEEVECDYDVTEECTYDENEICIYCGEKKPAENFDPSISVSISNKSCVIGEKNPIISVALSDEKADVEYAQICFANYPENSFINIGLSQGKYYDPEDDNITYKENDNWYGCPDISSEIATGEYAIRSIYIRSVEGESVHYSLESGTLPEDLQDISINILDAKSVEVEPEEVKEPIIELTDKEEYVAAPADIMDEEIKDDEPITEEVPLSGGEEAIIGEQEDEVVESEAEKESTDEKTSTETSPVQTEEKASEKVEEQKKEETSQTQQPSTDKKSKDDKSKDSNSNNNSTSPFNNWLDFFKKFFGWG